MDKENQNEKSSNSFSTSKCRRDLNSAFVNSNPSATQTLGTSPRPDLTQITDSLAAQRAIQGDFYTYAYSGGAVSLGRCCQPQICSILLQAIHSEYLPSVSHYRSSPTSSTMTSNTNESLTAPRPLHLTKVFSVSAPYRTCSHFGFNSPRQPPRAEHRHMPARSDCVRYRPMHRVISYEEIFATPRYEHLCQPCFEKLLRLKPELKRRPSGPSSDDLDELVSYPSSSVTPRKLTTLAETNDEEEEYAEVSERPSALCHVSTQTVSSFLRQLERLNFSEESTNVNYVPGLQMSDISLPGVHTYSSPAASATSEPPLKNLPESLNQSKPTITDITEVWNFGNWQQESQQDKKEQQPLTERHITLEITQQFNSSQVQEKDQNSERQLMSRDERHRRKTEFQELWQDHVDYFGAKEKMEEEATPTLVEQTLALALEVQEEEALGTHGWLRQSNNNENTKDTLEDETQAAESQIVSDDSSDVDGRKRDAAEKLPKMLHDFEQILSAAGENLWKLVATAKKLQADGSKESSALDDSIEAGSLFRAISLENIAEANDSASVLETHHFQSYTDDDADDQEQELGEVAVPHTKNDHEEKRDDEKPVTPSPDLSLNDKDNFECSEIDEKDVDENEVHKIIEKDVEEKNKQELEHKNAEPDNVASGSNSTGIFSPLEREILDRIEADKLKERESIFGRIDESIRNKFVPCRVKNISADVEETFSTCTHIFRSPHKTTPHLFQFSSEPRPSSYSMHNIDAPSSSSAHVHLITGQAPRLFRFSKSYQESCEASPSPSQSTSSLESSMSSKTFVCRRNPRQKRNFIQENIRNASKPRDFSSGKTTMNIAANRKSRRQETSNDAASVCTFQVDEERGRSARFWVTLPSTPQSVIGQKRRSGSPGQPLYPTSHSSCSPYGKRRKPIGYHMPQMRRVPHSVSMLRKSVSSRNVFSETYEFPDSAGLLQVESNTTFELENETLKPKGEAGEDNISTMNSTLYYSVIDSTPVETPERSQEMDETQKRLSGGEKTENMTQARQVSLEEEISNETTVEAYTEYTSSTDENSEPLQNTTGDGKVETDESNNENQDNNDFEREENIGSVDVKSLHTESQLGVTVNSEESKSHNKTDHPSSLQIKPEEATKAEEDNPTSISSNSNEEEIVPHFTNNVQTSCLVDIKDEGNLDNILEVNSSSTFCLSSIPAAFNLGSHNKPPQNSIDNDSDSSVDKEFLLAKDTNFELSDHDIDEDEDDNEPNTSAAATKKRISKFSGKQVASQKTEDDDMVVLGTQCTLHVTEEPLDDIQAPRNMPRQYNHFGEDSNLFEIVGNGFISADEEEELFEDDEYDSNLLEIVNEALADEEEGQDDNDEYEPMRIELNTSFLNDANLSGDWPSYLVLPPSTVDFGPFILTIIAGESTHGDDSIDDEHSMPSLEILQNEANQSVALLEEIRIDSSDNLGFDKAPLDESKD